MLLKFTSIIDKNKFMNNLRRLKSVQDKFKSMKIYVKHDETPAEREDARKMLQDAAAQNQQLDVSKNEKFVVRGPPWARRIIKIKFSTM